MAKKLFYKIGEACKQVDVQPYVLRYWETEFELLSPDKSKSGQRVYTEDDLAIIRRIKELLYDEGYTTVGAKKKLQAELEEGGGKLPPASKSKPSSKKQAPKEEEPDGQAEVPEAESASESAPETAPESQADPEQADPEQADPEQADPEQADPEQTESKDLESAGSESDPDAAADDSRRVEELEAGLRSALHQAREILQRLA